MNAAKRLAEAPKIFLSVVLLVLVFRSVHIDTLRSNLAQLDGSRISALLLVYWCAQALTAARWRFLSLALGMRESYPTFLKFQYVGMFFSVGLPSLVGGDVLKAYMVSRRTGAPLRKGLASVLQDRAAGLTALLIYGSAAAVVSGLAWRGLPLLAGYLAIWSAASVLAVSVICGEKVYGRWLDVHSSTLFQRVFARLAEFHRTLLEMNLTARKAAAVACLSFANSALIIFIAQQVCAAAGHPVSFLQISALVPLIDLITMLPISIAGIGLREWAYMEALPLVGIPREAALVIALALSGMMVVRNLVGGLLLPAVPASLRRRPEPRE